MDLEESEMPSFHENLGSNTFGHEIFIFDSVVCFFWGTLCSQLGKKKNIDGMEKASLHQGQDAHLEIEWRRNYVCGESSLISIPKMIRLNNI